MGKALEDIHAFWYGSGITDRQSEEIWSLQDGYGEPGFMPPQGCDWSGIRDSSAGAVDQMHFFVLHETGKVKSVTDYPRYKIESLIKEREFWDGDTHWETPEQWAQRKVFGQVGHGAAFTLVVDGLTYDVFTDEDHEWDVVKDVRALATAEGFLMEAGYPWSLHFYMDLDAK